MNLGSGIGLLIGFLIGVGFSVGGTSLFHFGPTIAFLWGMGCSVVCSFAGFMVGTKIWGRRTKRYDPLANDRANQ